MRKIDEGYDIVSGVREKRDDPWLLNRFPSYLGGLLINRALGIRQSDFGAVKGYSRTLVDELKSLKPSRPMVYAAAYALSKNFAEIPVGHQRRKTGRTKWSLLKRIETYLDIYTTYAPRPFAGVLVGSVALMLAGVALTLGIAAYRLWTNEEFSGLIIFFAVFLVGIGFQFALLSLIGEFVTRMLRAEPLFRSDPVVTVWGANGAPVQKLESPR
ncbi:MAG: hypothetical protein FJX65_16540 [Alphaproteobacteria bacterium]|nr:hypothetical protein [Alphaproteobacteria bacterium]